MLFVSTKYIFENSLVSKHFFCKLVLNQCIISVLNYFHRIVFIEEKHQNASTGHRYENPEICIRNHQNTGIKPKQIAMQITG